MRVSLAKLPQQTAIVLFRCLLVGGTIGTLNSLMVNSALVEVSCSPFFAVSFGLLFLASAATVSYQTCLEANVRNTLLLTVFTVLNLIAGVLCFLLERDWSHGITAQSKVPLYTLLGMCLAFSVNFSCLDLLARCESSVAGAMLVRTEWQVRVVAVMSMATGGACAPACLARWCKLHFATRTSLQSIAPPALRSDLLELTNDQLVSRRAWQPCMASHLGSWTSRTSSCARHACFESPYTARRACAIHLVAHPGRLRRCWRGSWSKEQRPKTPIWRTRAGWEGGDSTHCDIFI